MFPLLLLAALAAIPATLVSSEFVDLDKRQQEGPVQGLERLKKEYFEYRRRTLGPDCHPDNVIVRKEWGNLSPEERQDYIQATKCLYNSPAQSPPDYAPGARNRRDDFVAVHIAQQQRIHFSPWTLPFHRWYVHLYEKALRDECGYKGGVPYMGYENYGAQPYDETALFDGSPTSLGGNGSPSPDGCNCVGGPFAEFSTNLGPIAGGAGCRQNPQADGLGYNPRCLERNFDPSSLSNLTHQSVFETILGFDNINDFTLRIDQWPGGIHPSPHSAVGGAQHDIPGAPCDPWFFVHHAGLDLVWDMWVGLEDDERRNALPVPYQFNKERETRGWKDADFVTPDSYLEISPVLPGVTVRDVMNISNGPLCYVYE